MQYFFHRIIYGPGLVTGRKGFHQLGGHILRDGFICDCAHKIPAELGMERGDHGNSVSFCISDPEFSDGERGMDMNQIQIAFVYLVQKERIQIRRGQIIVDHGNGKRTAADHGIRKHTVIIGFSGIRRNKHKDIRIGRKLSGIMIHDLADTVDHGKKSIEKQTDPKSFCHLSPPCSFAFVPGNPQW